MRNIASMFPLGLKVTLNYTCIPAEEIVVRKFSKRLIDYLFEISESRGIQFLNTYQFM